jgi:pimeloyl-ACP methyl ester carboxylesterase
MLQRQSHFLASEGFAVLAYDKRGVGESGGVYSDNASESRLLLLAQDAAAGAAFLRAHPSIGGQSIGLYGGSQAGWIIPAAAALSDEINFVLILSGPVVTVSQEGIYSRLTGDGTKILAQSDEEIAAALEPASGSGFNPIPYIEQLEIPALWLWGGKDMSVPVAISRDNLEAIIDNGNKNNFDYVLFPNGDHALWESESGRISDWPYIRQTVPRLHDTIRHWLAEHVEEGHQQGS